MRLTFWNQFFPYGSKESYTFVIKTACRRKQWPFFPLCLVSVAHKVLHAEALPSTNIKHGDDGITSLSVISYSHLLQQVVRLYCLKLSRLSWGSHLPCALWLWLLGVRHIQAARDTLLPGLCCIPPVWEIQPASVCLCECVCVWERECVHVWGAGEPGITDPPWQCPSPLYIFKSVLLFSLCCFCLFHIHVFLVWVSPNHIRDFS